jgi:Cephalosporin hydroxylase.
VINLDKISFQNRRKLIRYFNRLKTFGKSNDLNFLATTFKTDKWGKHFYTPHYYFHFKKFKSKRIKVLEIGIGGYENPQQGGGSLRMWERFFDRAEIHGIDIYDKTQLEEGRIKIKQGSQIDQEFLESLSDSVGGFDIIIDDGSHINEHIIKTFEILFPKLKQEGIYVIEDVQTSYWKDYGGNPENPDLPTTAVGYFKKFIHGLNYSEFPDKNYKPTYLDEKITSIHFYHNLIFIYKGNNKEGSNVIQ